MKSILGREIVYVKFSNTPPIALLRSLEHVKDVKMLQDGKFELVVDNAPRALPEIFNLAYKLGLQIIEISYRRPTLNDVFVRITGR